MTVWLGSAVLFALSAFPTSADGYQRTQTCEPSGIYACEKGEQPKPVSWPVRCIEYRVNRSGASEFDDDDDGQIDAEARGYIRSAFESWNDAECSDLQLVEGPLTSRTRAEFDRSRSWSENTNLIVFRESEWPYSQGHSFALTSVTYNAENGRIADADIEFNAVDVTFTHFESSRVRDSQRADLVNALTHEVGHLVGLDHSGEPAATMYRAAATGETKKRTLHQDDIRGICGAYPVGDNRATCDEPEDFIPDDAPGAQGLNCSTAGDARTPVGTPLWFVVLLAASVALRRGLEPVFDPTIESVECP